MCHDAADLLDEGPNRDPTVSNCGGCERDVRDAWILGIRVRLQAQHFLHKKHVARFAETPRFASAPGADAKLSGRTFVW